jgi:hypothetical protein
MFGGPIGSQIGSQVGAGLGGMLENLIGQHGQSNVQGAMNNNMLGSLAGQLGQAIQCAPGIPQFARDEMCQALDSARQSCPAEPTTPGCQQDTDNAMGGLIDKIVDKVVDMIMDKLQGGGGCESGDFGKMLREAVEEVVREKIGGEDGGGCWPDDVIRPGNEDVLLKGGDDASASSGNGSASTQAEGSSEQSYDNAYDTASQGCATTEDEKKKGKGNWLVALAGALANVQAKFLDAAMENMKTMEENSSAAVQGKDKTEETQIPENETPEAKEAREAQEAKDAKAQDKKEKAARDEFLMAQSQYQANMQMFNMMANMTATSLKSLGEGLTSIARKQ